MVDQGADPVRAERAPVPDELGHAPPARRARMNIGIDARAASEVPAGRGRVVRELLRELAAREDRHEYRLYARTPWEDLGPRLRWVTIRGRDPLWHLVTARRGNRECDAFLSTNSYLTAWFTSFP